MGKLVRIFFFLLFLILSGMAQEPFQIHGHLTQAYGRSQNYQFVGLPTTGTTDYRNLALQFSYHASDGSRLVLQFSHQRIGQSFLMEYEEDVELDWGFFEYRFAENYALKFGRLQLPMGFYNELRDVGIVLPFYSVPYTFYLKGSFVSETLDGAALITTLQLPNFWEWRTTLFGGGWTWLESMGIPNFQGELEHVVVEASFNEGGGIHSILTSPEGNLKVGLGGFVGQIKNSPTFGLVYRTSFGTFWTWNASLEWEAGPLIFTGEMFSGIYEEVSQHEDLFYLQAGYRFNPRWSLYGQYGAIKGYDLNIPRIFRTPGGPESMNLDIHQTTGISLNYRFSDPLVVKVESHWIKGYITEKATVNFFKDDPLLNQYFLISIATAF
ncbi:MAG TPA: hypothetical protein PKV71_08315 [Calditrichia bacterium]|nr:hypothetical protein [Calditrichota bacterium]HQV31865.1 hypothetical protein [Calditrichia bacterium]